MRRPSGGDFDPMSAEVWQPNRIQASSGESVPGEPTVFLRTRIKSPRGLFTQEATNQGRSNSQTNNWIDVRLEGGGDKLTADMWIIHNSVRYDIKGSLGLDNQLGVARYQVVRNNDYNPKSD